MFIKGRSVEIKKTNTLQPDRLQRDRPVACVIAQQYSSATFVSSRFHYLKEKFGVRFK
jgi:hypothetical protein